MSSLKKPYIGVYGPKTRALQRRLSFEHVSLTWKTAKIFKYLGSRSNASPQYGDIQDFILLETRDRAYASSPIEINIWNEAFADQQMDFSKFGLIDPSGGNEQTFKIHVNSFDTDGLGRYIISGDIIQMPFFTQDGKPSYWEVTDVNRKTEFENYYVVITACPMDDKQETAEIANKNSQDNIFTTIKTGMDTDQAAQVPEKGLNPGSIVVTNPDTQNQPVDPRPAATGDFLDDPNKQIY
jgi:hypothetical protein